MATFTKIALLSADKLRVGYRQKDNSSLTILQDLSLRVFPGELITFIGPNGSGKSTLIKTLVGLLPKLDGNVRYMDNPVESLSQAQKAEHMGVVLTDPVYERNMTIYDLVAMGRYQHTNWFGKLLKKDTQKIEEAIEQVGLQHKTNSTLGELSDGEKQRAMIARVLAQDVDLIILDEPTAHLDLSNRMEVLLLLKRLAHEYCKGILLSTHELGMALQVSDRIWMIGKDKKLISDIPEQIILSGQLDGVFGNKHISFQPWSASFEILPSIDKTVLVKGIGMLQACVVRLLRRLGFSIIFDGEKYDFLLAVNDEKVVIHKDDEKPLELLSLQDLQQYLLQF